jgi:hypothetical protein
MKSKSTIMQANVKNRLFIINRSSVFIFGTLMTLRVPCQQYNITASAAQFLWETAVKRKPSQARKREDGASEPPQHRQSAVFLKFDLFVSCDRLTNILIFGKKVTMSF